MGLHNIQRTPLCHDAELRRPCIPGTSMQLGAKYLVSEHQCAQAPSVQWVATLCRQPLPLCLEPALIATMPLQSYRFASRHSPLANCVREPSKRLQQSEQATDCLQPQDLTKQVMTCLMGPIDGARHCGLLVS